jgi:hypothetical protein
MVCLILGLQFGGTSATWNTPRIIVLFTFFGALFLAFAAYETWLGEEATLPPRIAKNRTVMAASVFVLCIDAPYYAIAYYVSDYLRLISAYYLDFALYLLLADANLFPGSARRFRPSVRPALDPPAFWRLTVLLVGRTLCQKDEVLSPGSHSIYCDY